MFWSLPVKYEFHGFKSLFLLVSHYSPVPITQSGILDVNECLLNEYVKVQRNSEWSME